MAVLLSLALSDEILFLFHRLHFIPTSSLHPSFMVHLDHPFTAFTPPHHKGGHEQGDHHWDHDEGSQDAVGRVLKHASRQRAVVEVVSVDPDEKVVHQPVGPEAPHLQRHQEGAVGQLTVSPGGDRIR